MAASARTVDAAIIIIAKNASFFTSGASGVGAVCAATRKVSGGSCSRSASSERTSHPFPADSVAASGYIHNAKRVKPADSTEWRLNYKWQFDVRRRTSGSSHRDRLICITCRSLIRFEIRRMHHDTTAIHGQPKKKQRQETEQFFCR